MATAQSSKSTNNITLKFTAFSHKFIQIATFFCSSAVSLWPTGFPRWKPGHFCVSTIVKHLVPLTCWHWGRTCVSAHQKHNTPPTHVRRIRNAYHGRTHGSAPTGISQHCAETDSAGVDVESAQSPPEMGNLNDKMRRSFSDHPATCRRGGPMCPPVVGI